VHASWSSHAPSDSHSGRRASGVEPASGGVEASGAVSASGPDAASVVGPSSRAATSSGARASSRSAASDCTNASMESVVTPASVASHDDPEHLIVDVQPGATNAISTRRTMVLRIISGASSSIHAASGATRSSHRASRSERSSCCVLPATRSGDSRTPGPALLIGSFVVFALGWYRRSCATHVRRPCWAPSRRRDAGGSDTTPWSRGDALVLGRQQPRAARRRNDGGAALPGGRVWRDRCDSGQRRRSVHVRATRERRGLVLGQELVRPARRRLDDVDLAGAGACRHAASTLMRDRTPSAAPASG